MYLSLLNCIISDEAYQNGLWVLTFLLVLSFFQSICAVVQMQSEVSRMDTSRRVMVKAYAFAFASCVVIVAFLSLVVLFWFLGLVAIACR